MFLKGLWDQHRAQKWNREQLRKSFGKAGRTEYADGELNGIVRYFEKHPKDFQIDDITWNDLNLDEIFLRMNSTCSSAGQEYLYAMLRSPSFEEKELQEREKLLEFLEQDEETRVRMQEIFFKIGRTGKYSLYDYMDFLDVLGERKNGKHLLVDLLFFLAIAAAFVSPPLGLCGVSAVMCFNITTYLKEKKQIEPYLTSFHYIFRLIRGAEELSEIHAQQLEGRLSKVRKLLPQFGKLNRSASLGMRTSSCAILIPRFRALDEPPFGLWKTRILSSFSASRSHSFPVPSVDPSSTSRISRFFQVCPQMLLTHRSRQSRIL